MTRLFIDIETFSAVDLKKTGLYKYANDVEIILFSYAYDDGPVQTIDLLNGELVPAMVLADLINPTVIKSAFNAIFEIMCIQSAFKLRLDLTQWACTQARCAMAGVAQSLGAAAKALGIKEQKDTDGMRLIRLFSVPCKASMSNGGRTRNLPHHYPEDWLKYKRYNADDVYAERGVYKALQYFFIPPIEHLYWVQDQLINMRGVYLDHSLAAAAVWLDTKYRELAKLRLSLLTGALNPNSRDQFLKWLNKEAEDVEEVDEILTLRKKDYTYLTKIFQDKKIVIEALDLKKALSRSSIKKYQTMLVASGADGRLRGVHQYYGAATGRAAGRLLQTQNLPAEGFENEHLPIRLVKAHEMEKLTAFYGNIPDTLTKLIRNTIVAPPGKKLVVGDFKAIEAVVLAHLAGEQWRLEVFKGHGKIYEASAAKMFKVPFESIKPDSPLRKKGKVSELALGYNGGVNALIAMGAIEMGIPESELPGMVNGWRMENPNIVAFWRTVQKAAITAIYECRRIKLPCGLTFDHMRGNLYITLPSGRKLSYYKAHLSAGKYDSEILYWRPVKGGMILCKTYGGRLVENIVQACARDILYNAIYNVEKKGFLVIMHVHDEIVAEIDESFDDLDYFLDTMRTLPAWAAGLPLNASGYIYHLYKK